LSSRAKRPDASLTGGGCPAGAPKLAARQDGALVVTGPLQVSPALMIVDQNTGNQFPAPAIPPSTFTNSFGQSTSCDCFTRVGQPMVDSDGSTYVEYNARQGVSNVTTSAILALMKIAPDGTTSATQLTSSSSGNDGEMWPGVIIPDGQGGVLATWIVGPSSGSNVQGPNPYRAAHVTPGSTGFFDGGNIATYVLPMAPTTVLTNNAIPIDLSLVLGENGVAFVTYPNGTNVASFNLNTGAVNWNYQNTQGIRSVSYTNGGGLTVIDGQSNQIAVDSTGNAGASVALSSLSIIQSTWTGAWQAAIPASNSGLAGIAASAMDWGHSFWGAFQGSPSQNGGSAEMPWFPPLASCLNTSLRPPISCPGPQEAVTSALTSLKALVGKACLTCASFVFQPLGSIDDQTKFSNFLNLNPGLYDGTRSDMPLSKMCTLGSWNGIECSIGLVGNTQTVSQFFRDHTGTNAIAQMPAKKEPLVFFNPSAICSVFASQSSGIFNQARLFHETLHGFYGKSDATIQEAFSLPQDSTNTINITFYIQQKVFGKPAGVCAN
jgi:hypothetical protein